MDQYHESPPFLLIDCFMNKASSKKATYLTSITACDTLVSK